MEQIALDLAKKGYAVFPLAYHQKTPATAHGYKDATKDESQIHKWWHESPNSNIGIACGAMSAGLVAIDIDCKHGHDGFESLKQWFKDHGSFPQSMMVQTPNGGMHVYYRDKGHWNSPVNVLDGVDIRCNGSYIVAPGSVLNNGTYEVVKDGPQLPSMINESLRELLKLKGTRSVEQHEPTFHDDGDPVGEGGRNKFLSDKAGALVKKYPEWTESQLRDEIRRINAERCIPPLEESELQRTVFKSLSKWKQKRDNEPPDDKVVGTNFTPAEWQEIEKEQTHQETEELSNELPMPTNMADVWDNPPELAPPLIEGILRVGHKMILTAPSKAGKSFDLIELAFACAEGMNWAGHRCRMGNVMYMNMEIDRASFFRRIKNVYSAHGMNQDIHVGNIDVWNLRGHAVPITKLAPLIIDYVKKSGKKYEVIIIDPLYKVMSGDENSNSDTAEMLKAFDMIANETGASVVYSHHFAKGNGGDRSVIDRGAGAGVFARDPDAIVTMTQLDYEDPTDPNVTAWRMEFVLREFPSAQPVNMFFRYPIHVIDSRGVLDDCEIITTATTMRKAKAKEAEKQNSMRSENIRHCAEVCRKSDEYGGFTTKDFIAEYEKYEPNKSRDTIERRLKAEGYIKDQMSKGLSGIWHKE